MLAAYLLLIQFCIVIFQEWRNEEMALIDELYSGPERKAALVGLLEQEAHLIASIDRHKLVADEENKDKRIKSFLNKVCSTCVFLWCRVTYGLRNWKQPTFRDVMLESIPAAPDWRMPGPPAVQNLHMPHPRDWKGPGGWWGGGGDGRRWNWLMHYHWFPPQNSEFTLQDGRKKGTAKRLCETNVTAPFLMCLVVIFT